MGKKSEQYIPPPAAKFVEDHAMLASLSLGMQKKLGETGVITFDTDGSLSPAAILAQRCAFRDELLFGEPAEVVRLMAPLLAREVDIQTRLLLLNDGSQLVVPIASAMSRQHIRSDAEETHLHNMAEGGELISEIKDLKGGPRDIAKRAIVHGDRALSIASGWVGARNIKSLPLGDGHLTLDTAGRYTLCQRVAIACYERAIEAANEDPELSLTSVPTVEVLMDRFHDVVAVLFFLNPNNPLLAA